MILGDVVDELKKRIKVDGSTLGDGPNLLLENKNVLTNMNE